MSSQRFPNRLPNKPLVEALVELRWGSETEPDEYFSVTAGRLYEKFVTDYRFIENVLPADVPINMSMHLVRHRFRKSEAGWPLIQVGPGIVTFNETTGYYWEDFRGRAEDIMGKVFEAHPKPDQLKPSALLLRYINAISLDYLTENVLKHLEEKMRLQVGVPQSLLADGLVAPNPVTFSLGLGYSSQKPRGTIIPRFTTGQKHGSRALVWELNFQSSKDEIPPIPGGFPEWLLDAHDLIEKWFFELTKGPLQESFGKA